MNLPDIVTNIFRIAKGDRPMAGTIECDKSDFLEILDEMAQNYKERGEICVQAIENNDPKINDIYDELQKTGQMESNLIAKHIHLIDEDDIAGKSWPDGFRELVECEMVAKRGNNRYVIDYE